MYWQVPPVQPKAKAKKKKKKTKAKAKVKKGDEEGKEEGTAKEEEEEEEEAEEEEEEEEPWEPELLRKKGILMGDIEEVVPGHVEADVSRAFPNGEHRIRERELTWKEEVPQSKCMTMFGSFPGGTLHSYQLVYDTCHPILRVFVCVGLCLWLLLR
jgi:hypothetical protein